MTAIAMKKIPLLLLALAATAARADLPDRATATAAVERYLAAHGDFCLGKTEWPVDLSALDLRAHGRDTLQMPVLESLGLVHSAKAIALRVEGPVAEEGGPPVPIEVLRYTLTPAGEAWFKAHDALVDRTDGERLVRARDLCPATLKLEEVVGLDEVAAGNGVPQFVARYTYVVADVAPWATTPEFRRVFPLAARVIDGAHAMRLEQRFRFVDGQWVATVAN